MESNAVFNHTSDFENHSVNFSAINNNIRSKCLKLLLVKHGRLEPRKRRVIIAQNRLHRPLSFTRKKVDGNKTMISLNKLPKSHYGHYQLKLTVSVMFGINPFRQHSSLNNDNTTDWSPL